MCSSDLMSPSDFPDSLFFGGLFLEPIIPLSLHRSNKNDVTFTSCRNVKRVSFLVSKRNGIWRSFGEKGGWFLSISLSIEESSELLERSDEDGKLKEQEKKKIEKVTEKSSGAFNTTKHLSAGAVSAMVSRTFVAPLERLKLESIVRGEQKNLVELIKAIAATQGIRGFWKGNFVNILRTAPFKSINFYAYDTYKDQQMKISRKDEATNFEIFVAGAAAGITATLLCLPMDTDVVWRLYVEHFLISYLFNIWILVNGVAIYCILIAIPVDDFSFILKCSDKDSYGSTWWCNWYISPHDQDRRLFSLYKGLVPSIISMAPSIAVFYGVYDILKLAYLHSPEGKKRIQHMKQEGQELSAFEQMELSTVRTLLYGAIAEACSEAATYPFEVLRRQLQMQVQANKLNPLATCIKVVEQGGVPALYAGLVPSLLQVLPSAAISYRHVMWVGI